MNDDIDESRFVDLVLAEMAGGIELAMKDDTDDDNNDADFINSVIDEVKRVIPIDCNGEVDTTTLYQTIEIVSSKMKYGREAMIPAEKRVVDEIVEKVVGVLQRYIILKDKS